MNKKTNILTRVILVSVFHMLLLLCLNAQQSIDFKLQKITNCQGKIQVALLIKANTNLINMGSSSIFLNYPKDALSFDNYNANEFNESTSNQAANANWLEQKMTINSTFGLIHLVLLKEEGGTNNYQLTTDNYLQIGLLDFSLKEGGSSIEPNLSINEYYTGFYDEQNNPLNFLEEYEYLDNGYLPTEFGYTINDGLTQMGSNLSVEVGQKLSIDALADNSVTYTWVGPNGLSGNGNSMDGLLISDNITLANSGQYTITFITAAGCENTVTYQVEVIIPEEDVPEPETPALDLVCEVKIDNNDWIKLEDCMARVPYGSRVKFSIYPNNLASYYWTGPNDFKKFGNANGNVVIANFVTEEFLGDYTVTITTDDGSTYTKIINLAFTGNPPVVNEIGTSPYNCTDYGTISFGFQDSPYRTHLQFSLDGGYNYYPKISDADQYVTYGDLDIGTYDLYVRWGNGDYPTYLKTVTIDYVSETVGAACDDGRDNTINDVIQEDGCACEGTRITPCNKLEVKVRPSKIIVENILRKNPIIQLYNTSDYNLAYGCFGENCSDRVVMKNLASGEYMLLVKLYNASWDFVCETSQIIKITGSTSRLANNGAESRSEEDLYFTANKSKESGVTLKWLVNSNQNITDFEIEHSVNGLNFEKVATIKNKPILQIDTLYQFLDVNPIQGINYYRLKINYKDAPTKLTDITIAIHESILKSLEVFPNPTSGELYVNLQQFRQVFGELQIFNQFGQQVKHISLEPSSEGRQRIDISTIDNGIYYLIAKFKGFKPIQQKLIIQKPY